MSRLNALRLAVAAGVVATLMGGAMLASPRSADTMAKAATVVDFNGDFGRDLLREPLQAVAH